MGRNNFSGLVSGTIKGYNPDIALGIFIFGGMVILFFERGGLQKKWMTIVLVCMAIGTWGATCFVLKKHTIKALPYICDPYMINSLIIMIGAIAACYWISRRIKSDQIKKVVTWGADKTLGIYLMQGILYKYIVRLLNYFLVSDEMMRKVIIYFGILFGGIIVTVFLRRIIPRKVCNYIV